MTETQVYIRLQQLINAHAWSRLNDTVQLSDGQRICLSQERAALMTVLDGMLSEPAYTIPEHLNEKVNQITAIIKETNWQLPEHTPEPY